MGILLFKRRLLMLISLVYLAIAVESVVQDETCPDLPSFCRYIDQKRGYLFQFLGKFKHDWLRCQHGFDVAASSQFERFLTACQAKRSHLLASSIRLDEKLISISISIRASTQWSILNDTFRVFNIQKHLATVRIIRITHLKGFDIDSIVTDFNNNHTDEELQFYTDFNLYKNNKVVTNCEEFIHNSKNYFESSRFFIFRRRIITFSIHRPQTLHPVCSLFFRQARINCFKLVSIASSFYMKNSITFGDPDDGLNLNSSIREATFNQVYAIDLDSKLLNPQIFASIDTITVSGHLNSIEQNVFATFGKLRWLNFKSTRIMDLIRRQGIEWIKRINSDLSVDVRNPTEFKLNKKFIKKIIFESDRFEGFAFEATDFCLFRDFPFRQMVFMSHTFHRFSNEFESILYPSYRLTCTQLWLFQFNKELFDYGVFYLSSRFNKELNASNFTACEFEKRIQMCNRSQYHFSTPKRPSYTWFDFMVGLEFAFVIILPVLFGGLGIATNLIVIRVIFHEKNKKTMLNKQYIYMRLHCLSNILICSIQFLNLLNECQYPYNGLFCSSIRHLVGIQYLRIIFGEYLNSVLRLVSNFTYFGFSICRLAKIGNKHGQFIKFFNEDLSIKVFVIVVIVVSAGFSVCKWLQLETNYDYPSLDYPSLFSQIPYKQNWFKKSNLIAVFIINIIYNVINYFVFVLVHLIVDVILIKKLWQVMREKEEKMREMKRSEKEMQKTTKENEESKRRSIIMVISNSTLNFCLKIPLLIPALNDLRLLIHESHQFRKLHTIQIDLNLFSSPLNFKYYCLTEKSCQIFHAFGNCFFLLSLSTILFFLKHFDMNFKSAFKNVFYLRNKKTALE